MRASMFRRTLVGLVLTMIVVVPCAVAATGHAGAAALQAPASSMSLELTAQVWSWFKALWPDEGCRLDPDGLHCAASAGRAPIRPDEGCRADPSGRCLPGAVQPSASSPRRAPAPIRPDEGCRIDPSGRCLPSAIRPSATSHRR
jgi:hypothetical protein